MTRNQTNRTILYYLFFAGKMDESVKNVTAQEIADGLHLSRYTVADDFARIYKISGRQCYGYNVKFMYNFFSQMLQLPDIINLLVIGPVFPFISINLENRNIHLQQTDESITPELCNEFDGVVLTRTLDEDEFSILETSTIRFILNFSGEIYNPKYTYIENFNIMSLVCSANVYTIHPEALE